MNEDLTMVEGTPIPLDSIHPDDHIGQNIENHHHGNSKQAAEQATEPNPSNVCDPVARAEICGVREQMDVVVERLHKILEKMD